MGWRAVAVIGAAVLTVVGCGGRVIDETESAPHRDSGSPNATSNPNNPSNPGNTGKSGGSDQFVGSSTPLPDCELGSPPTTGAECAFLTSGRCYDTKIKACACACPRRTGTVCGSGFPNSEGRVVVSCS
jgi:hypothetical protein